MTKPQIEEQRKMLNEKYYGDKMRIPQNLTMPMTKADKILEKRLSIADMMVSNLVYGGDYFEMCKSSWYIRNCRRFDWEELEDLGVKDGMGYVKELWEEMQRDFKEHCIVKRNVYTDSEGLTYNSTEWN